MIDGISFEIYEKYRTLTAVYKCVLKDALAEGEETPELTYAILKGCNIGLLLKEKHAETGCFNGRASEKYGHGRSDGISVRHYSKNNGTI